MGGEGRGLRLVLCMKLCCFLGGGGLMHVVCGFITEKDFTTKVLALQLLFLVICPK